MNDKAIVTANYKKKDEFSKVLENKYFPVQKRCVAMFLSFVIVLTFP
ncbi:hypothetical protein [Enterococcus faecium]